MYLLFLAEYGLLGLVLFLGLFGCIYHGNGERKEKVVFGLVLGALALTTHNMLEEPFYLIGIALMSSWRSLDRGGVRSDEVASFKAGGRVAFWRRLG
jgi:hypothetical protein